MNKKFQFLFMMFFTALCLGFTACSDDDDDDTDYAQEIAGTYVGTVTIPGMGDPIPNVTIVFDRNSQNKITMKMNQTLPVLGEIEIESQSNVTYKDNKYYVSGTATHEEIPVKIDGSVDKEKNIDITIGVAVSDPPMEVIYKGKRQ